MRPWVACAPECVWRLSQWTCFTPQVCYIWHEAQSKRSSPFTLSDLDVAFQEASFQMDTEAHIEASLHAVKDTLLSASLIDSKANAWKLIPTAKVPIVKVTIGADNTPSRLSLWLTAIIRIAGVQVDINVNQPEAPLVPIAVEWIAEWPRLGELVLLFKIMLSQHGLNDASKGGMSSYTVLCMMLYMLKTFKVRQYRWSPVSLTHNSHTIGDRRHGPRGATLSNCPREHQHIQPREYDDNRGTWRHCRTTRSGPKA